MKQFFKKLIRELRKPKYPWNPGYKFTEEEIYNARFVGIATHDAKKYEKCEVIMCGTIEMTAEQIEENKKNGIEFIDPLPYNDNYLVIPSKYRCIPSLHHPQKPD